MGRRGGGPGKGWGGGEGDQVKDGEEGRGPGKGWGGGEGTM